MSRLLKSGADLSVVLLPWLYFILYTTGSNVGQSSPVLNKSRIYVTKRRANLVKDMSCLFYEAQ